MLRLDDLENGYRLWQDPEAFCFGIDAVLLAHFGKLRAGDRVLDFGTGNGVIPHHGHFHLGHGARAAEKSGGARPPFCPGQRSYGRDHDRGGRRAGGLEALYAGHL